MTDWKAVAGHLEPYQDYDLENVSKAIRLCEEHARGEWVRRVFCKLHDPARVKYTASICDDCNAELNRDKVTL